MSFSGFTDQPQHGVVHNNGFWPDVDIADFQAAYRVPAEFEVPALQNALARAMDWANQQLADFEAAQREAGHNTLGDVPAPEIAGQSRLVGSYEHAVCCRAMALLTWEFRPLTRSSGAKDSLADAEETALTEGKWIQFSEEALAAFRGQDRVCVRLI